MHIKSSGNRGGLKAKLVTLTAIATLSGAAVFMPYAALAQSTADVIAQLQAQIAALTAQLAALSGQPAGTQATGSKCTFTRSLTMGARGDDVKCLQSYLMGTGHFTYSGGATGYFGSVTKAAVAAWQAANSVSPAVGYFGTLSRAKYDSIIVVIPPPVVPPVGGGPVVVPAGSGLTVTASVDQPASTLAPQSAARVPFVKSIFTASADGNVTVKSVTVERRGLADDAAFDGIILLDDQGVQIGTSKTLSSEHLAVLNEPFTVNAGTSKVITVAANMSTDLAAETGQIAKLAIKSVDAGTTAVNGAFPMESNSMTVNNSLTIGSATMSIGAFDPGAANTKDVGTRGYYLASIKAAVGSAEDVSFEQIRFNQAGSAAASDLANVVVKVGDKEYPATISSDGKYFIAMFEGGLKVTKGASLDISVKADLINGSARTVDMDILKKADIVLKGKTFGYYIIVGGGSSGAASAGAFSSNQEPFFNAYATTINKGSMLISSSNAVTSGNVPIDVADTTLGAFTFDVKGEPMQISSLVLNFTFTGGGGTSSDITSVKLFDETGNIVAGPKDPASGIVTWTDTWTAPVGAKSYTVKGRLDTSFATNNTVTVGINGSNITSKGTVTGLTVSPTPTSLVNASTQTVKGAALSFSVAPTPAPQNVVRNIKDYLFATYIFDATQSGEDVRIASVQLQDTLDANTSGDEINSCILYDGATALNTGSDVVNPSDPASGTDNDITFTMTNNLVVPKGTVKRADLKCNIVSSAANNTTHAWGTSAAAANISATGKDTGAAITETITTATGQLMTVKTAGSYTVTKSSSAPSAGMVLSGKMEVPINVLTFRAVDEAINITDLTLTYSSSTASTTDFSKVTLWDGATKIGEAQWAGSALNATSTLSAPFVVSKDGEKELTLKVDLSPISVTASTTAGRLLAIDYNGISSSTGTGQSSGARLGSSSGSNSTGASMQIMKSFLTLEKVAVPSTTLPQTDAKLYRFKVSADAAGPIALYKFTFQISSSTVSATTSNFRMFAYTDSGFSQKKYDNNPINFQNVDCVSLSTFESVSACTSTTAATIGSAYASTSEVVFFFSPSANTASTSEAIVVPAGQTVYFELVGDITNPGSGTGNNFQVSLLGDAARPVRDANTGAGIGLIGRIEWMDASRGYLGTAAAVASQSVNNDFVWSPMSTSTNVTTASSSPDWTNGFLVPGLPSTNMSANTFSN